jgi:membrane protease YdiL (CAAX protease family)
MVCCGGQCRSAKNPRHLKDLGKILLYFAAVIALGALLAPPLYWAGHGLLPGTDFQRFFNRSALIAAFALLWPVLRWLRVGGVRELGLASDSRWWQRLAAGFVIAGGCVALLATGYVVADVYHWKNARPWNKTPMLLLSSLVVAVIEESLFRAGILGLFRRSLRSGMAVFATAAIFSAVHFLKPDEAVQITQIGWLSGFELIPHVFHQFAEPMLLLGGFTTIFALGLMLGDVTVRTRSLWLAIGLHAGLVFVKMSFSKFTKRDSAHLPWIGEELQIGLVPVLAILCAWLLARLWLKYVDARRTTPHA